MNTSNKQGSWSLTKSDTRVFRVAFTLLLLPLAAGAAGTPQVWTLPATAVTTNTATLNGTVNPSGRPTGAWFQWGTMPLSLGNYTPVTDMGSGSDALPLSVPLAGLTPGVRYHFRAAATNSAGAVYGALQAFTAGEPQVLTLPATAVGTNAATLNGTVSSGGYPTTAWFQWGTTVSYGNLTPVTEMGSETSALPLSVLLDGLTPGVTYHFRVVATNSTGVVYGTDQAFTTLALPQVWTLSATAVSTNGATLNGRVEPHGHPTAAWFEWGTTTSYGNLTQVTNIGSEIGSLALSVPLAGLSPGVTYHFRLAATNSAGAAYGQNLAFITPGRPQVWTLSATAVTTNAATLNGTVNPSGYPTAAWFEWAINSYNYTNHTPVTDMGSGTGARDLSVPLGGLTPGVNYHFRVAATNSNGAVYGSGQAFTTRRHGYTNTVTTLANSGAGSLRQVIADSVPGDTIVFGVSGVITLTSGELAIDKDLTIIGPGAAMLAISGGGGSGFRVCGGVRFTLRDLAVTDCWGLSGAGIYNDGGCLLVQNCLFARNTANCGGAVFNSGTATITSSTFVGNYAVGTAGSDAPWGAPVPTAGGGGGAGSGGAVFDAGNLEVRDSTFLNNSACGGIGGRGSDGAPDILIPYPGGPGGPGGTGTGGALEGVATIVNSTFIGNSASGGQGGPGGRGGDSLYSGSPPRYYGGEGGPGGEGGTACGGAICGVGFLTNCTIAANSGFYGAGGPGGPGGYGGLGNGPDGPTGIQGQALGSLHCAAALVNTILSGNAPGGNCSGTITDAGHNLSSDASCAFTNSGSMNNTDPKLGPLADNGGATLTMSLLPASPAIDGGDTSLAPAADQRGFPRPAGLAADIGAFEYGSVMPTITISRSGGTGLNLLGSGNAGHSCRLLSSPDLSSWVPIATNQIGGDGTFLFYDTCGSGAACRYYRLVMP